MRRHDAYADAIGNHLTQTFERLHSNPDR
jgi:hypothetical protein